MADVVTVVPETVAPAFNPDPIKTPPRLTAPVPLIVRVLFAQLIADVVIVVPEMVAPAFEPVPFKTPLRLTVPVAVIVSGPLVQLTACSAMLSPTTRKLPPALMVAVAVM